MYNYDDPRTWTEKENPWALTTFACIGPRTRMIMNDMSIERLQLENLELRKELDAKANRV